MQLQSQIEGMNQRLARLEEEVQLLKPGRNYEQNLGSELPPVELIDGEGHADQPEKFAPEDPSGVGEVNEQRESDDYGKTIYTCGSLEETLNFDSNQDPITDRLQQLESAVKVLTDGTSSASHFLKNIAVQSNDFKVNSSALC